MSKLDTGKGKFESNAFVYVIYFESSGSLDTNWLVQSLQRILYDDIGATGHFRLTPAHKKDLTDRVITSSMPVPFIVCPERAAYVAFTLGLDNETPIAEEATIIPSELDQFCAATTLSWQQVDIRDLYAIKNAEHRKNNHAH